MPIIPDLHSARRVSETEIEIEESSESNENQPSENGKACKLPKIQNGISEQYKLNNNVGEEEKCSIISSIVSNGSSSRQNDDLGMPSLRYQASSNTNEPNTQRITKNFSTSTSSAAASCIVTSNDSQEDAEIRNNVDYICGINKCPPKVSCSTSANPKDDPAWSTDRLTSECTLNNIGGSIGSTSQGTCCFLRPNINGSREVAGPSGIQKKEQGETSDSSSGNEGDMSDGEDYCIYTYKGNDNVSPEERVNPGNVEQQEDDAQNLSGRSSPEMDFLEMDFDPGPSCEQDTGDSDLASINEDIQNLTLDNAESDPMFLNDLSSKKVGSRQSITPTSPHPGQNEPNVSLEAESQPSTSATESSKENPNPNPIAQCLPSTSSGIRRPCNPRLYRTAGPSFQESVGFHNTSGDLISPGENRDADFELWADANTVSLPENSALNTRNLKVNLSSTLYHRMMAKKLMLNKQTAFNQSGDSNLESELCNERIDGLEPIEKVMIWSEQEATIKQVTQIATSACGATAAVNVFLALDVPFSLEVLVKGVSTRLRERGSALSRYLVSRSHAGATHNDIIRGLSLASNGAVVSKFFAFYPERAISLTHWLHYWISKGAIPIATLNLQKCGTGCEIPDAWHHQMIFGVSSTGIYFTNPLKCLPEQFVWQQLTSPSVLLIRRADVLAHWNPTTDLTSLTRLDYRWRRINVLGQVVNMVRDSMVQRRQPEMRTSGPSHIRIPASYQSGILLVMKSDAPAAEELLQAEELPLL